MSIFDERGNLIPWGPTERVRVEPFIATATLPQWLSIYDSAGATNGWALGSATGTTGYLQVNTPTAVNTYAVLNLNDNSGTNTSAGGTYALDLMEIRLSLEGLVFSHDENLINFEFDFNQGTTRGVKLVADSTGTFFQARNAGALTRVDLEYNLLGSGEWQRPRNLEFIVRPDRWCILREFGKVVGAYQFTAAQMAMGQVSPKPAIFNRSAGTARWLRVSQLGLTLCH